jgi:hypothetical protein
MSIQDELLSIEPTFTRQADALRDAAAADAESVPEPVTLWRRPLFHAALSATVTQPCLLVPQDTGDLLRYTAPHAGPLPLGGARAPGTPRQSSAAQSAGRVSRRAQQLLLPAPAPSPAIPPHAQRLYRGHSRTVVAAMFLADAAALLTVDLGGVVALWPVSDDCAAPLGWFEPVRTLRIATAFTAPQLKGPASWHPDDQGQASLEASALKDADGALDTGLVVLCAQPSHLRTAHYLLHAFRGCDHVCDLRGP